MKHRILMLFLLILPFIATAQEMEVVSMKEALFDITASTNKRLDNNGKACALIKVVLPIQGASFEGNIIDNVINNGGEYWVYLTAGSKFLKIKHPEKIPLLINIEKYGLSLEGSHTYELVVKTNTPESTTPTLSNALVKKNDFYIEVGFGFEVTEEGDPKFIPLTLPIAFGGHIQNINIEADFGLLNIIDQGYDSSDYYNERKYSLGMKLGYGFCVGNRFKITPQVGYRYVLSDYYGTYQTDPESDNFSNVTVGVRSFWALSKRAGITLTPEYGFAADSYGGFDIKVAFALTF